MAKLTISWLELKTTTVEGKSRKLINGTFIDETGAEIEATIWREDREGKVFPNFDTLAPGQVIEATPWKHPTKGTYALYAPKEAAAGKSGSFGGAAKAMETKKVNVREAQEFKQESIEKSACQRDAILLTTTFYPDLSEIVGGDLRENAIKQKIEYWRSYLSNKLADPTT